MIVELEPLEEARLLRETMMVLLRRDPHCSFAQLLGQRLMDLIEQHFR